jgi:hypothetical protein
VVRKFSEGVEEGCPQLGEADGNVIQIEAFGCERPDATDEYDANWLRARCSVNVAEFSAVLSLALVTQDFARFTDELERAVELLIGSAKQPWA